MSLQNPGGIAGFVEAIGRGVLPADFMKMVNAQTRGAALGLTERYQLALDAGCDEDVENIVQVSRIYGNMKY